jgi:6-phosphogluconolactonase/glucosamine-6-phosphate isomerase/deaminase
MEPSFLIFDSADAAAGACADPYSALSGGSTPRLIFETMAKRSFDWRGDTDFSG